MTIAMSLAAVFAQLLLVLLPGPPALLPGAPVARDLAAGESHSYRAALAAGRPFLVAVEQEGIDVAVSVFGPDGRSLAAVDSPLDRQGRESLLVRPATAGDYRIEVRAKEPGAPPPGRYAIRLEEVPSLAAATPAISAEEALTRAGELYLAGTADARRRALPLYRQAREGFRAAADRPGEARALYETAVVSRLVDETRAALGLARKVLPLWQALGETRFAAATENEIGLDRWLLGEGEEARAAFGRALALARGAGDRYGEAVAQSNLCLMDLTRGDLRQGVACYGRALPLLEEVRAEELLGGALISVGHAFDALGEPREARDRYAQALARLRSTGNRAGEGRTLNNLGVLEADLGDVQAALAHYGAALATFRALEDRRWQARVLNNLGLVYHGVGERERALSSYTEALALWRAVDDRPGEAATLTALGSVQSALGRPREALASLDRALALRRAAGDRRGEGIARGQLGKTQEALGDRAAALAAFTAAASLLGETGDLPNAADALRGQGEMEAALGEEAKALESLERSLTQARAAGYRPGEAQTLYALARAERRFGRAAAARGHALEAIGVIESLRERIRNPDLRASYAGLTHRAYELAIDLAMAAPSSAPEARDREALGLVERARARTLLQLLAEAGVRVAEGVDAALLARREALLERLAAKAERAATAPAAGAAREGWNREIQEIQRELDLVDAQIRAASPGYAALTQPQPLAAADLQALLDPDAALLVYALGEERSFLWWVAPGEIASFVLPPRGAIEETARKLHTGWSAADTASSASSAGAGTAADLARMLLGPVAERLARPGGRILAVVPDGALAYVPFAALPLPDPEGAAGGPPPPVLARYEVVALPSATALAVARRLHPKAGRRWLAAFADPVFDPADPRLPAAVRRPAATAPVFARLPASRQEAAAIAALAPPGEAAVALDFDASRAAVSGARLAGYRAVHFATHGVIDAEHPALSGLALSTVDRQGHPQEGFLSLSDLYNLRLDADLVVLSGCRTALGREVRGEGLVGLARGFQYAGAARVVASLWRVEDRATAELMTRFYRALWREGRPAAAALREAQLALRRERRFRDPSFWAAFVLAGDWR
jgi:CHAT domain-containing protein/tetratricopeptide (TPR) repeat protein